MQPGEVLGDRYRILQKLGMNSDTYLAQDVTRANARCLLIQLFPQGRPNDRGLEETAVLSRLQHPQLPRFRELIKREKYYFWVEDYIEGHTYRTLLQNRRQQGKGFSELEVTLLLLQLLPVLEYIHAQKVVHQTISPDTLMLRSLDGLPVLINLVGIVKPTLSSPVSGSVEAAPTRHYELHEGQFPHSDLYALAVTMLELLTGKAPQQLFNPRTLDWNWQREITLSPQLTRIFNRMLAKQPKARFGSAVEVRQALKQPLSQSNYPILRSPDTKAAIAPKPPLSNNIGVSLLGCFGLVALLSSIIAVFGTGGWLAGKAWLNRQQQSARVFDPLEQEPLMPTPSEPFANSEGQQQALERRRRRLGINKQFYQELIDQAVSEKYLRSQMADPKDAQWQQRWNQMAAEYLDKLSFLSAEARQGLGTYDRQQRDRWKRRANQLHLSSRALYDLVDRQFFSHFPEQENQQFLHQPIGQVWQGTIVDTLDVLQSGEALKQIELTPLQEPELGRATPDYEEIPGDSTDAATATAQVNGRLKPGEGKAYIVRLEAAQQMKANLEADQETLLSIYSPTGSVKMLEDSRTRQWSGNLPEDGFYEIVIVSNAERSLNYQLTLTVDTLFPGSESP